MQHVQNGEWTLWLEQWRMGEQAAYDRLMAGAYHDIKRLAAGALHRYHGHALTPTELTHEAYLKLAGYQSRRAWQQRGEFYALMAQTIRSLLIDNVRKHKQQKRGGGWDPVTFDELSVHHPFQFKALNAALARLERLDQRRAGIWMCRYLGGLSIDELSTGFGLGASMLHREIKAANGWLRHCLQGEEGLCGKH